MKMDQHDREILLKAVEGIGGGNILVIGDVIIDHFIWGKVSRISPEAPVPVVDVREENLLLGGAANVLNNIYSLGGRATLCGVIGDDVMADQMETLLQQLPSPVTGLFRVNDRPTMVKTRVVAHNQQVVRFDRERRKPLAEQDRRKIEQFLDTNLDQFVAIVVSDYDKGLVSEELMDFLRRRIEAAHPMPLIVDPKPGRMSLFRNVSVVTPNNREAELMAGMEITDAESLRLAAGKLLADLECEAVLITRGEEGMALMEREKPIITIPTKAKEVYDVTGAGDTVVAVLALGLASGLDYRQAAFLANYAAGIVVGKVGTATTTVDELKGVLQ
ncbi:MAG: D-glycero-beta-D-manno-heptose-7-phosphate kinase [Deltaproteobacteria bacterium]